MVARKKWNVHHAFYTDKAVGQFWKCLISIIAVKVENYVKVFAITAEVSLECNCSVT